MRAGNRGQRGHVLHFHGQAAGRFEQHRAALRADRGLETRDIERIEKARLNAQIGQQAAPQRAARVIGVVGHQQHVAGAQHGKQRAGDGGNTRGIEHGTRRAGFELGQRFGQRPLRRRAAAAIEEAAVGIARAPSASAAVSS